MEDHTDVQNIEGVCRELTMFGLRTGKCRILSVKQGFQAGTSILERRKFILGPSEEDFTVLEL